MRADDTQTLASLPDSLTDWLVEPRRDRGISFLESSGYRRLTYDQLRTEVRKYACYLSRWVKPGDRAAIMVGSPYEFVLGAYATLHLGGTIVPIASPTVFQDIDLYVQHVTDILSDCNPVVLLVPPFFTAIASRIDTPAVLVSSAGDESAEISGPPIKTDVTLLQYTSGSTSTPKGVILRESNLLPNIDMLRGWAGLTDLDRVVTWLPMHHDMGLIGTLMLPVTLQLDLLMMSPEQFVRQTDGWLEAFDQHGATVTASPPVGFSLAMRRSKFIPSNLSAWGVAICGAEPIDPVLLHEFVEKYRPAGFRPEAICPAYGMAEAALAITGVPPDRVAMALRVDGDTILYEQSVSVIDAVPIDQIPPDKDATWVMSCGSALPGTTVRVLTDEKKECPDRMLGEIWVGGASVSSGYNARSDPDTFDDGWLRTGDCGFMYRGELYVVGRIADRIKLRGRTVYAEELEMRVQRRLGLRSGSVLVLPSLQPARQGVVAFWESRGGSTDVSEVADSIAAALNAVCGGDLTIDVFAGPPGSIPRTTSAKPKRRKAWTDLATGKYGAPISSR